MNPDSSLIEALASRAVNEQVCTALALRVLSKGAPILSLDLGHQDASRSVALTKSSMFDLASLTKALSTAILAAKAVECGLLAPGDVIPRQFSVSGATLGDLLQHASGLPAYLRAFETFDRTEDHRHEALELFRTVEVSGRRRTQTYSDIGYIVLGRWLAAAWGEDLDSAFQRHISGPLGLVNTGFSHPETPRGDAVVTEWCPLRRTYLQGIVHDENCQVLGGVAGHAGLFATADDVMSVLRSLLGVGVPVLGADAVDQMWDPRVRLAGGTYVRGWDTPSGEHSNAGQRMSRQETFGHLGFTGTSVWVDRSRELAVVLLTNRVHPSRDNPRIAWLRPRIHDLVVAFADQRGGL